MPQRRVGQRQANGSKRLENVGVAGAGVRIAEVGGQAVIEEGRLLGHIAHGRANFRGVQLAQVEPAQAYGAHVLGIQPHQRFQQGGFAAAARAGDGDDLARLHLEVDTAELRLRLRG